MRFFVKDQSEQSPEQIGGAAETKGSPKTFYSQTLRGSAIVETMAAVGLGCVILAGLARITTRSVNFNEKMHGYYTDFRHDMGDRSTAVSQVKNGNQQQLPGVTELLGHSQFVSILTQGGKDLVVHGKPLRILQHQVIEHSDRVLLAQRGGGDFDAQGEALNSPASIPENNNTDVTLPASFGNDDEVINNQDFDDDDDDDEPNDPTKTILPLDPSFVGPTPIEPGGPKKPLGPNNPVKPSKPDNTIDLTGPWEVTLPQGGKTLNGGPKGLETVDVKTK